MEPWNTLRHPHHAPVSSLIVLFAAWKAILFAVAIWSPGPGYDTSTQILFRGSSNLPLLESVITTTSKGAAFAQKLVRWDALYFVPVASRGYRYEQEWAFGWGFTRLLAFLAKYVPLSNATLLNVAYHGIIVANLSHLLSVLVLYRLAFFLPLCTKPNQSQFAFIAAACHVLSPAGLFLSAPYAESLFSLLNFLGQILYVSSYGDRTEASHTFKHDFYLIFSGLCFGVSATVRGNGLLSGILFAYDASIWLALSLERMRVPILTLVPSQIQEQVKSFPSRRLPATIVAGVIVGLGLMTPQYIAYMEYCGHGSAIRQPWCSKFPPSIFSWVQNHYWNVGFLKYWTVSNIPLFLLATPMLCLLSRSIWSAFTGLCVVQDHSEPKSKSRSRSVAGTETGRESSCDAILFRLALPQLALVVLASTTIHVQIITRLSSGYPLWYLLLARDIVEYRNPTGATKGVEWRHPNLHQSAIWTVRWMVMYALIQGALFASFLPPA